MDVIFDWNLGNLIYNGLITLRRCGFPFAEIGVASVGIRAILYHRTKPLEMDDRIGREQPFFRLYTDPAFTSIQGLSIIDLLTPISLKLIDGNERAVPMSWCVAAPTHSSSVKVVRSSFFSTPLSQSSATSGSGRCHHR